MLNNIGTVEIVVIAIVLLVLFGGKKLPELVQNSAKAIKEFKKSVKD